MSDIVRSTRRNDYSDKDLEQLVKRLLGAEKRAEAAPASPAAEPVRPVRVPGGDFFSSDQYASVRQEDDNFFSRMRIGSSSALKRIHKIWRSAKSCEPGFLPGPGSTSG